MSISNQVIYGTIVISIILIFFIRSVLKKSRENRELEEKLEREDKMTSNTSEEEGDLLEKPKEQGLMPEEEIEKYADEKNKEYVLIRNYLIKNEPQNLDKAEFFDLQERILISNPYQSSFSFDIEHIYGVAENKYVAVINFSRVNDEDASQEESLEKRLLGIIKCNQTIGRGILEQGRLSTIPPETGYDDMPVEKLQIGKYILNTRDQVDPDVAEDICRKIEGLSSEYTLYFDHDRIYIRQNSYATMKDLMELNEALINFSG